MKLAAGRLDREITFLTFAATRDERFNTPEKTWIPFATVWAEVRAVRPGRNEQIERGVDISQRPARVIARWRDDITPDMRVRIDGRDHEIVGGPVELGRREGIELLVVLVSTQGDGA